MSNLPSPQTDQPSQGADHTIFWTLILLSICVSCMLSFLIPYWIKPAQGSVYIPVSILAKRNANYQADLLQATIPPLDASILQAVIQDNDPQATNIGQRIATLQEVISEPVPTATPVLQPTSQTASTQKVLPTNPIVHPSSMPPANTPTPISLPTQVFTATAMPTNTPLPTPTVKHTSKPTHAAKPSHIPKPTHAPKPTHIPKPTHAPKPTHSK